jgi:hypothetical protein
MGPPAPTNEAESRVSGGPARASKPEAGPTLNRDFNMRIARDGTWFHQGAPINRQALVKLFSTVLRRHDDGTFWLTTPVETGRIEVEDAPFIAVELMAEGEGVNRLVRFRTNVDDVVTLDKDHPLRVEEAAGGEPRPYVMVRNGLEARLARSVFYELVEMAETLPSDPDVLAVRSAGQTFPLGRGR